MHIRTRSRPNGTRKQTLVNAERYITEELKEYEEKILGAEEKILALETRIFNDLVLFLADYIRPIQLNATLAARLDVLVSFAVICGEKPLYTPGAQRHAMSLISKADGIRSSNSS